MQKKQKESRLSTAISTFSSVMIILMFFAAVVGKNMKYQYMEYNNTNRSFQNVMADLSFKEQHIEYKVYDEEEFKCLRKALFFEVRKNFKTDMQMVGNVIFNRMKAKYFPNTICGVVLHKGQFEYVMRGLHDYKEVEKLINKNNIEKQSWELANELALEFLTGDVKDLTNGATAFHATSMQKPDSKYWRSLKKTTKTSLHVFYK